MENDNPIVAIKFEISQEDFGEVIAEMDALIDKYDEHSVASGKEIVKLHAELLLGKAVGISLEMSRKGAVQ